MTKLDELIADAGRTHVIEEQEDPRLLEQLRDPAVLARAEELLDSPRVDVRQRAILCIERIGYVLRDQRTAEVLLDHALRASGLEAYTTLEGLRRCTPPSPLDGRLLTRLIRDPNWRVWTQAVRCSALVDPGEVEEALLERVSSDREGLVYVAYALRDMRSQKSLEALEYLLGDQSTDVRCVALDSLGERLGSGVLPHARSMAGSRHWIDKYWAAKWLGQHGSELDVPFAANRVRRLLTGGRKTDVGPPELSYLITLLRRFEEMDVAQEALQRIRTGWARLPPGERNWLEQHARELIE